MPCTIKNPANIDLSSLEPHVQGMYDYFDQKLGFQKPPTIVFDSDPSNQDKVLGKTAYYDPDALEIYIYSDGRHPKDMLRSIAHELIHHQQNLEGRLDVGGYSGPGYYLENDKLRVVEHEAMLEGNKLLREYEDTIKKESKDMSLKEWKNNELNQRLMKRFGILKENNELEEEVVEEGQDEIEEGQSVRQGTEDRDVGRDRQRADRMHEDEEVVEEAEKPDYLDLDKDGDKEESMKDAAEEMNEEVVEENSETLKKETITVPSELREAIENVLKIAKGK